MPAAFQSGCEDRQRCDQRQRLILERLRAKAGIPFRGAVVLRVDDHQNTADVLRDTNTSACCRKQQLSAESLVRHRFVDCEPCQHKTRHLMPPELYAELTAAGPGEMSRSIGTTAGALPSIPFMHPLLIPAWRRQEYSACGHTALYRIVSQPYWTDQKAGCHPYNHPRMECLLTFPTRPATSVDEPDT